jgi:LysM repeat protein
MPSLPTHALDNVTTLDNVKDSAAPGDALSQGNALTGSTDQAIWKDAQANGKSADLTKFGFSNFSIDGMAPQSEAATGDQQSYTVQKGDSLWAIARDLLTAPGQTLSTDEQAAMAPEIMQMVDQIARDNGISDPSKLQPGEELTITGIRNNFQPEPSGELQSGPPEVSASEPAHSLQSGRPDATQPGLPEVSPSSPSSNPPESSPWYAPLEKAATSLWQSVEQGLDKSAENLVERAFDHLHLGF